MNSKLFRRIAALAGCVALALPAAASGKDDDGQRGPLPRVKWVTLVLKGKIVKVGEKSSSLVVAVKKTNRPARRYRGKRINVDIASETRLRTKDHNGDGERDAADLAAGDRVVIKNRVPKGFAPPLEDFRMLPQLIIAERPAAEETPETETTE
jgi:hypothetical protein